MKLEAEAAYSINLELHSIQAYATTCMSTELAADLQVYPQSKFHIEQLLKYNVMDKNLIIYTSENRIIKYCTVHMVCDSQL